VSKLNTFVTVHSVDGEPFTFGPSDELPTWAEKAISNPNVWAEAPEAEAETPEGADGEPPRAGAGSGLDAWKAYAAAQGIQVPDDAKREDIFALVDASKEQ
jgi:hypothetical protein